MDRKTIPGLIGIIVAILMVVCLFLPYTSATEDYAEYLSEYDSEEVYEDLDMTGDEMVHLSMVEYARVYATLIGEDIDSDEGLIALICIIMVVIIGVFSLLILLFNCLKKPIGSLIFNILAIGVFWLQCWDYEDRGVIPSSRYDWGIVYYLFYIVAIVGIISSIWMIIEKKRKKKALES